MTVDGNGQQQTDDVDNDTGDQVEIDDSDVKLALGFLRGDEGTKLLTALDDGAIQLDDPSVEDFLRGTSIPKFTEIADWIKGEREAKETAERERQEAEYKASDDALAEKIRADLAKEADDATAKEREDRIRADVLAQLEREKAGTTGPDPVEIAEQRLSAIADALSNRDLPEADRKNLWAESEVIEDVIEKATKPSKVEWDPAEFEKEWVT